MFSNAVSKNLNKRFFAEYLTVLALTIDPDPSIENEEPEIYLSEEEIEKHRNWSAKSSRRGSSSSSSSSSNLLRSMFYNGFRTDPQIAEPIEADQSL